MATNLTKNRADVYVGLDISTSPGFAAVSVKNRKPTLLYTDSTATDAKMTDGLRFALVEAATVRFMAKVPSVASIIREDYANPRTKRQGQAIWGAWAAVDLGLARVGRKVDEDINATTVKKIVGGHGKAEKDDVADGVRRILGLTADYVFVSNDESDAAAVILAWLIENKLIDGSVA